MFRTSSSRATVLPLAFLLALGGCVAAPVAQLAAQAMSGPAPAANQIAQAPSAGMAQAAQGLSGLLQRVTGIQPSP